MSSEPDQILAKFAVSVLVEVFKEAIKGVTRLSAYLSHEAEKHDLLGTAVRAYTSHLAERFNTVKVIGMQSPIALERIYTKVRVLDRLQKRKPGQTTVAMAPLLPLIFAMV